MKNIDKGQCTNIYEQIKSQVFHQNKKVEEEERDIFEELGLGKQKSLGQGQYGNVYDLGNERVVKVIKKNNGENKKEIQRSIKRQRQILEIFQADQKIIKYYGSDEDWTNYYLFFKKYKWDLRKYLQQNRAQVRKNILFGVKVFLQCLFQLSYLHKQSIIHRDIKPKNILLNQENGEFEMRLGDFGCGKKISRDMSRMVGTQVYLAPQNTYWALYQIQAKDHEKVDLWSLAITIAQIYFFSFKDEKNIDYDCIYNPFKDNLKKNKEDVKKFYEEYIIEESISLPLQMPEFLKYLIREMLIVNPSQRISFSQIYKFILQNWQGIKLQYPQICSQQNLIKIAECKQIQQQRNGLKKYSSDKEKLMTNLYYKVYKPIIEKVQIKKKQMQYFLKFIYFIIKNILKIRKELKDEHEFKNKDIKIAQQIKNIKDMKYQIQILLLEIKIDIKKQINTTKMLFDFVKGRELQIEKILKKICPQSLQDIKEGIQQIFQNKQ